MTIGSTFPVRGDDKIKSVPWGLLEAHRSRAMKNHGAPLERLYALGGLTICEIARVMKDTSADAAIGDDEAREFVLSHRGVKEEKPDADAKE